MSLRGGVRRRSNLRAAGGQDCRAGLRPARTDIRGVCHNLVVHPKKTAWPGPVAPKFVGWPGFGPGRKVRHTSFSDRLLIDLGRALSYNGSL